MADDKDMRMEIEINARTNKKQVEKEVKKVVDVVDSIAKDGRIDITIPIDINKKTLTKAQKEITAEIAKMTSEGFSASGKDIDTLSSKLEKFMKSAKEAGKDNRNPVVRAIRDQVKALQQQYKELQKVQKSTRIYESKTKHVEKRTTNRKQTRETPSMKSRRGRIPGGPKGYPTNTRLDRGVATSDTLMRTEYGSSYEVKGARQAAISRKEAEAKNAKTLRKRKNKEEAEERIKNKDKATMPVQHQVRTKKRNGKIETTYVEGEYRGPKKRELTKQEKGKEKAEIASKQLADIIGKIERNNAETTIEDFNKYLKGVSLFNEDAQRSEYEAIRLSLEQVFKRYFSVNGTLGVGYDKEKGVGPGHENAIVAIKGMFKSFEQSLKKTGMEAELARVRKVLAELGDWAGIEDLDGNGKKRRKGNNLLDKELSERIATKTSKKLQKKGSLVPPSGKDGAKTDSEETTTALALYRHFNKEGRWVTAGPVKHIKYRADETNSQKLHSMTNVQSNRESSLQISKDLAFAWKDGKVINAIKRAFGFLYKGPTATDILSMSREEQEKLQAERIARFGLARQGRVGATGDKADIFRRKSLYWRKDIDNPFRDLKLTEGMGIDSKAIANALQKNIEKNMFTAQTGGIGRNILGAMTGYIGMPSLEKSRADADAANQILSNIRNTALELLSNIQEKETALRGLEKIGQAKFDTEGRLMEGSSTEAITLFARMEEQKQSLTGVLAEAEMLDELVSRTGGKLSVIFKRLGFVTPELRENNKIIQNVNAGLTKTGKALKFQTRTGEVLNYSFQLMARSVGRMWVNWMKQLNPITQIKKAFKEFMGYNTKWQRTMNVIKYNIHGILEPFMDKIAQFLINVIGFVDIISMKIQKAFGAAIPISLFNQAAADTQKMKEELEAAANVSAGFDELHDIGSDNSGANDLMGEIYKPQLPKEWEDFANKIGDWFANIIPNIKNIGEYITKHWKDLLKTLLEIFLGWQLLKIAGKLLWNALFGNLTGKAFGSVLGKLGVKFMDIFTATQFGSDFVRGIKAMFTSGGMIGTFKAGGASLGAIFAQAFVATIGVAIGVSGIAKGFDMVADTKSYNMGLLEGGGKSKDKKSDFGGKAVGTILGGIGFGIAGTAIAGFATGGPIGFAIGAIAGLLITSLAPAFEEVEVASKKANNEMQKIEYYEGLVKGAESETNIFKEQLELLQQSLELNTQAVYDQGEKLGISKTRMNELVKATEDGTFSTSMLTGSEVELAGSLTNLAEKQLHVKEVSEKLEEAQKKLLKAQTELSIAQDIEAGNFELAAARIELAEAQGVYSTEDATAKRIQLYKRGGEEERKNLLQNLTPEQRTLMAQYTAATDKELGELSKIWQNSSDDVKKSLLAGVGPETQSQFQQEMNSIDAIIQQHQGFWQGVGDTIKEIFTFGNATTWTYNGQVKYDQELQKGKYKVQKYAVGTNYVPSDGLAYLHQGEAVIPAKYNQPYQQGMSNEERAYMQQMMATMRSLDGTMKQGIKVNGEFTQRGSDLVAVVNKTKSQTGSDLLSNVSYAR